MGANLRSPRQTFVPTPAAASEIPREVLEASSRHIKSAKHVKSPGPVQVVAFDKVDSLTTDSSESGNE